MTIDPRELRESAERVLATCEVPASEGWTWSRIVELGWLLVAVPEALGGLGQTAEGACVLQVELARKLSAAPYLPALLVIEAVSQSDHPDRGGWLERLSTGKYVAAPLAESSLRIETLDSGTLTLSGSATAVQSADKASHVLIWNTEHVALVGVEQPGVALTERSTWDTTRRLFDVQFVDVELDRQLILASADPGAARRLSTLRDFGLAADAVGAAAALLALTVEHLQNREQFGRPLAMFQALKHRCADMKMLLSGAEAALFDSLGRCGSAMDGPKAVIRGKKAKYLACSAFSKIAEEALQLHGGVGMAAEHPCHLFLKRALLSEHLGRSGDRYEVDIADDLLESNRIQADHDP